MFPLPKLCIWLVNYLNHIRLLRLLSLFFNDYILSPYSIDIYDSAKAIHCDSFWQACPPVNFQKLPVRPPTDPTETLCCRKESSVILDDLRWPQYIITLYLSGWYFLANERYALAMSDWKRTEMNINLWDFWMNFNFEKQDKLINWNNSQLDHR